jgi:catechol 2,3-dioxygenase-like lactoylglutathione lyase family enzyme
MQQRSHTSAVLPGAVRQIGYIVDDLDEAIATWLSLGVGPWFVLRGHSQGGLYRGQPCTVTLSVAFANSGDLQVELIHQDDDTPSIYTEFLANRGPGFHQLAWWASDFYATVKSAQDAGWPVVWTGGGAESVRYAYLEPPAGPATIIEIMELNDLTRGMDSLLREAAAAWDGSDPIRSLG